MVSTRSQLIIRARRFANSRRFMVKTTSGAFVIDVSTAYREITVTQTGVVDLTQFHPLTSGKSSGNGMIQQSPLSMRHVSSVHATQTIHRIVVTNAATGCRHQIVFDARRMHSNRAQEYLVSGFPIVHCSQTKEDVKLIRYNLSLCKGPHGRRF